MKRALRWGLGALLSVLALLAVLAGITAVGLGTEGGSRWLLAHLPGVEAEGFEGRLGGQWQANRLTWAQPGGARITLDAPRLRWAPACLWRLTLCVEQLAATRVDIEPGPAAEPAAPPEPLALPSLRLPVSLELGSLNIGEVRLAGEPVITQAALAARWDSSGLQVATLQLAHSGVQLNIEGTLRPEGNYPLDARVRLTLPPVDNRPWALDGTLKGEVGGTLALAARSSGYLDATLEGELQPLAEHLPASLKLTAAAFLAQQGLPATLTLNDLQLTAAGDLQQGYAIQGNGRLPGEQGPVALTLWGQAGAEGAQVTELTLAADPSHRVTVAGTVGWADGLAGEATLSWEDFPWTSLYPQATPPPVQAHTLKALVRYGHGNYLGNLAGDFQGPAGPFSLSTPFSGNDQQLLLPQLQLNAGKGELAGLIKLDFAQGIGWAAELTLARLDPAYWLAALPGQLAGTLASEGSWRDGALSLGAQFNINGRLRGQPARLQGEVTGQGAAWQVKGLDLALGANRLSATGTSGGQRPGNLAGTLTLDAPRLEQLWPGLAGKLQGQLGLAGRVERPQGQLQLNGQGLAWQGNRVRALALSATLDNRQQGMLSLKGSGLAAGETDLGVLSAQASGDLSRHTLRLGLDGPALVLALSADGSWGKGAWAGRLASGSVASHGQAWALQAPASLRRQASGVVELGAHCWRSGPASLCADNQRLAPDPQLRLHLRQFPLASLKPWLPADLAWEGNVNGDVQLDLAAAGPRGQISLDASGGTLGITQGDQHLRFPYGALQLASTVEPRRVQSRFTFDGQRLGKLQLDATLDPFGAQKPLSGSFRLDGLDLAVFGPLVDQAGQVAGRLQGSGQLGGTLLDPRVEGVFSLAGGALSAPALPLSLEAVTLEARMSGTHLQLEGGWRSGAQGQGRVEGSLDWADALHLDLAVKASRLPVAVQPYAQVEAGADLHLTFAEQKLALAGKISVPKGSITLRQLPPSTVKVSDDAVVVGREAPARSQMAIAMDVDVDVGSEQLTFSGFGLQSDIAGHLHIGDNMDTRGSLELRNGRYRAYGQRLTLRRARLFFTGPVDQPYLDLEAIRQTGDVIAGIRLSGSAQQPVSEVFAEPAMSQEQALSWLVLGRPLSTDGEDSNLLAQAALGLGLMGSASTTGKLAKGLGVQDFQLDTEGSGDSTSVVASGNLTDRLTLRYGVGVFEPANTVALRYALTRQLYLEAASGVASSLDLFYKKDF